MAWLDYKKVYDSVPHSWIMETLEMVGAAENIKLILKESMKMWKTQLTANNEPTGEVAIKRGIFQGDSLSPLLFVIAMFPLTCLLREASAGWKINHLLFMDDVKLYGKDERETDSLVQTVKIFSNDVGMDFGINKCAVLVMKRGN